jgi:ANTAR domain
VHGYRSLLSTHLSTNGGIRAALNLHSHTANTFDESARTTASLFGLQAALLLYGVNHARQFDQALQSRDLIGQAKGILMERFRVNSEQAFRMLVSSLPEHQHQTRRGRALAHRDRHLEPR